MTEDEPYHADPSLKGKLRRRLVRLVHRRPARLGAGARPMVSFAFDDAPASAFHAGAQVLERHGARGTYFICGGLAGTRNFAGLLGSREDVARAHAAGHEIGCHTYSHLDCGKADADTARADFDSNASAFAGWGLPRPETFAYPYGDVGPAAKSVAAPRFRLSRALHHGVVEAGTDLNQTPAVGIEAEPGEALAGRWLEVAEARRAWLILFTHGVEDEITRYGCTVDALDRLVGLARTRGFDIVTVAEGARRVSGAETTERKAA